MDGKPFMVSSFATTLRRSLFRGVHRLFRSILRADPFKQSISVSFGPSGVTQVIQGRQLT